MKKKIKLNVSVTARDIAQGKPNNCTACPIALALRRALKQRRVKLSDTPFALTMGVRASDIVLDTREPALAWEVPERISQRVRRFDDIGFMKPFKFVATYVRNEN